MPTAPDDHLLRTFAAVPVSNRILVVGAGDGRHAVPLSQLGFEVHVTDEAEARVDRLRDRLTASGHDHGASRAIVARPQALGYPDELFHWAVLHRAFDRETTDVQALVDALVEIRRVVVSGGWIYVAMDVDPQDAATDDEQILGFYGLMKQGGFELAERAEVLTDGGARIVRGIFRRVDEQTPI